MNAAQLPLPFNRDYRPVVNRQDSLRQLEAELDPPCREKFLEAWWTHIGLLHEPRN